MKIGRKCWAEVKKKKELGKQSIQEYVVVGRWHKNGEKDANTSSRCSPVSVMK